MQPSVREIRPPDIPLIADYWLLAEPEDLLLMGADPSKLPSRAQFTQQLSRQIVSPYGRKQSYALLWLLDGQPAGHCNVNKIKHGEEAYLHLHLWEPDTRQKGMGLHLLRLSLPYFFEKLALKRLFSEPYAHNPAPNRTLERLGFTLVKEHRCTPGDINFEQEVKRWQMDRDTYEAMGLPQPD